MTGEPARNIRREYKPLPVALAALGTELRSLARLAEGLQSPIAGLIGQVGPDAALDYAELQGMDILSQTLADLSAYAATLAQALEEGERIDPGALARGMQLSDLALRLCGPGGSAPAASGGCEFFGD